ncbi:response regulator [Paraburkholderia sediminicola]|uniref:Response regulator n=1 Tax=Paraburkholderia rhynchosiae TaxID=487049 RepID=A0ACC7NHQ7_9BURK
MAYDGETALRLLRTGAFEINFRDENLPDIKGSAVAWSLRETPIRSAVFLVSRTGDAASQGDIARLFDVYLQKPFSCEALMQVIEDAPCSSDANTRQATWPPCHFIRTTRH